MSLAILYRHLLERELGDRERALVESLLARSELIDAMERDLPEQIKANRSRRTGKPVVFSKKAKAEIREFEEDAREAAAQLPGQIAEISTPRLLKTSLESEKMLYQFDLDVFGKIHAEDLALFQPKWAMMRANIGELEAFLGVE